MCIWAVRQGSDWKGQRTASGWGLSVGKHSCEGPAPYSYTKASPHPRSQVPGGGGTAPAPSQKPNCLSGCLNQRTFPVQLCSVFLFTSQKPRGKKLCRLLNL